MTQEDALRLALLLVVVPFVAVGLYHRVRSATGEPLSRLDEGLVILVGLRLCGLVMLGGAVAWLIDPRSMRWAALPLPVPLRWAGALVGAAALPLLFWTLRSLGRNLTDTVATRRDHTLVTAGPYRYVRHPFYLCGLLLFVSLFLMTASALVGAAGLAGLVLIVLRTPIEERKLVERFGDEYREYARRTGRFFPRVRPAADRDRG